MARVLFTADLHGNAAQYETFLREAKEEGASAAIIGGDLAPTDGGVDIREQRVFLGSILPEIVRRESAVLLCLMPGNDDAACNADLIERHHGDLWQNIDRRRLPLAHGYEIVGYPVVPLSPFPTKDYEKFDMWPRARPWWKRLLFGDGLVQPGAALEGSLSGPEGWEEIEFDKSDIRGTIEGDLEAALFTARPQSTIYCFHCPPYGTPLDLTYSAGHVGSRAIREFVEQKRPLLALSGHVHETVERSGAFEWRAPQHAVCASPGNFPERETLAYLSIELETPLCTVERKVVACRQRYR